METLWKNNLNCVKDVPIVYAYFIITVNIVSDKKTGRITFVPTFVATNILPYLCSAFYT